MALRKVGIVVVCILAVASIMGEVRRPATSDAPLFVGAKIPGEIRAIFERSCRDCHSQTTRYPWYSHIAPVSWLINQDVKGGRERLDFSKWSEYSLVRRERALSEIANQVQDGGMPLGIYTFIHRGARLSAEDVNAIFAWTQSERERLIAENAGARSR